MQFDSDPENMLSPDEPVRVFHNRNKAKYDLYDMVIIGIVNTNHPDGVFNGETLGRIETLTRQLAAERRWATGNHRTRALDLQPTSMRKRILSGVSGNDPHELFDENGDSAIIKSELISPLVVDNIKQTEYGW